MRWCLVIGIWCWQYLEQNLYCRNRKIYGETTRKRFMLNLIKRIALLGRLLRRYMYGFLCILLLWNCDEMVQMTQYCHPTKIASFLSCVYLISWMFDLCHISEKLESWILLFQLWLLYLNDLFTWSIFRFLIMENSLLWSTLGQ